VNLHQLLQSVIDQTVQVSLPAFGPELALCAAIVVLLILKILDPDDRIHPGWVFLAGSGVALWLAAPWRLAQAGAASQPVEIFGGMLVFDTFSVYMRSLLFAFVLLLGVLTRLTGLPSRHDATDIFVLVLGATVGMCLMVSANHMLIVFLGVEMASVPSYVLAGMLKDRRAGSEAALKFAIYGAGTAGVMLYGISLLVGALGSAHLPTMAGQLAWLHWAPGADYTLVLMLGGLMVMVGLAFKLSAVPFHFWAPDVFEGAPAEVAAFLSVASKGAALALLMRLGLTFGASADPCMCGALWPAKHFIVALLALLAAVTCTFGNLAAYGQTNMKRMLAYSTIAHAGYMMMAVAAAVALAEPVQVGANRFAVAPGFYQAVAALGFYLGVYLFMNLGAFAFVALLRDRLGSEQIDDYAGLLRRSPGLALCMSVILLSLVGLPPLAGFAGKFTVFAALFDARLLTLLVIGGLNTVLSLFYYLRVVRVMTLQGEPADRPAPVLPLASPAGAYFLLLTVPVVVLGLWWNGLLGWAAAAAFGLPL